LEEGELECWEVGAMGCQCVDGDEEDREKKEEVEEPDEGCGEREQKA